LIYKQRNKDKTMKINTRPYINQDEMRLIVALLRKHPDVADTTKSATLVCKLINGMSITQYRHFVGLPEEVEIKDVSITEIKQMLS